MAIPKIRNKSQEEDNSKSKERKIRLVPIPQEAIFTPRRSFLRLELEDPVLIYGMQKYGESYMQHIFTPHMTSNGISMKLDGYEYARLSQDYNNNKTT